MAMLFVMLCILELSPSIDSLAPASDFFRLPNWFSFAERSLNRARISSLYVFNTFLFSSSSSFLAIIDSESSARVFSFFSISILSSIILSFVSSIYSSVSAIVFLNSLISCLKRSWFLLKELILSSPTEILFCSSYRVALLREISNRLSFNSDSTSLI